MAIATAAPDNKEATIMQLEQLHATEARIDALIAVIEADAKLRRGAGAALRRLRGLRWATQKVRARMSRAAARQYPRLYWRAPAR
jgi:hypothetical protein